MRLEPHPSMSAAIFRNVQCACQYFSSICESPSIQSNEVVWLKKKFCEISYNCCLQWQQILFSKLTAVHSWTFSCFNSIIFCCNVWCGCAVPTLIRDAKCWSAVFPEKFMLIFFVLERGARVLLTCGILPSHCTKALACKSGVDLLLFINEWMNWGARHS